MELTIKQGYKQTEVGLIPEDWTVKKFDDFGRFFKGKGIKKDEVRFEGNPCVRYGELYTRYDNVITETFSFISNDIAEQSIKLKKGDLLFAGSGETREDIGKSAVVLREDTYAGGDIVVFRAKDIDPVFLGFISNSIPVSKQKAINGQGDAVVHIYAGGISKIQIPLPPTLTEQKAIATALSDVDALIRSLEALITKKKAIKQGAMQELLTPPHKGGKRLPGFSGEWVEKTLGEVGDVKMCKRIFSYQTSKRGDVPFYKIGTFGKEPDAFISWDLYQEFKTKYSFPKKGYLLISASGTIGRTVEYLGEDSYYQDSNIIWIDNDEKLITNKYLDYTLKIIKYNTEGSTIKRLYNSIIKSSKILIPPTLVEQKAIAQIFSDMDEEVVQLETKKEKYQAIKQGMMQELLTGKTRLV